MEPNLVYVILVLGLWAAVTAAYIPGSGLPEGVALLALGGGVLLLTALPTNWLAVITLFIGVLSFLLIPFLSRKWARLAEGGLILQLIGALTLFNGPTISLPLIVVSLVLSVAYHRLVLLPFLEKSRQQPAVIDDNGQLIGAYGRVAKASEKVGATHIGTINVRGEQWTAYSDYPLKTGEEVVVLERDGLQLYVEGLKHKASARKEMEENT